MSINEISEPFVAYMRTSQYESPYHPGISSLEDMKVFEDVLLMNQISEEGIPYALFQDIQKAGPLMLQEWADILGVSSKTLTRYRKEGKVFQPWHSAVILQVTELLTLGMDIFGTKEKLYDWLTSETFALGSRSPLSLLSNAYGRQLVIREMTHIEHGIFA